MYLTFYYYELSKLDLFIKASAILTIIFIFAAIVFSIRKPNTEKLSAYECGFDPYEDARNLFDIKFYLVSLIFLLFDLEAIYFFPWCISLNKILLDYNLFFFFDFIFELLIGYIYIHKLGILDWD